MLHMHEVTGSSPVVPTTKKAPFMRCLFCGGDDEPLGMACSHEFERGAAERGEGENPGAVSAPEALKAQPQKILLAPPHDSRLNQIGNRIEKIYIPY